MLTLAAAALLAQTTARLVMDKSGWPASMVLNFDGRTYTASPLQNQTMPYALSQKVRIGAASLEVRNYSIVISGSKKSVDAVSWSKQLYPNTPQQYMGDVVMELRAKGAISLGDSALCIYSWDNTDNSGEPSTDLFALDVSVDDSGAPVVRHAIKLVGLGQYTLEAARMAKHENKIVLVQDGFCVIDIASWTQVAGFRGNVVISDSGRIYKSDHGLLTEYSIKDNSWKFIASVDLGYLKWGSSLGTADVLVFKLGLWTPDSRATYRFPGTENLGGPTCFFVVPNIGIGFLGGLPESSPGVFLSAKGLQPISKITR